MTTLQTANPGETRIGWIGTGVMGSSMCGNLMKAGFSMTAFSRTRSKVEPLIAEGATWASSPREVAKQSDIVFSIVGMPADVRQVTLDPEQGGLVGLRPGGIWVDMTTSSPELAVEIYEAAKSQGVAAIDAPVSGGDVGAKNAMLSIMAGGDKEAIQAVGPCFAALGKTMVHQGAAGAGQHVKMANQILVASGMVGVCEALLYASKAGLDLETVLQSVSSGAAGSWALSNIGPRIIAGDFEPGFFVDHFVKDLGIALSEARKANLDLPGLALADKLYREVQVQGHGSSGTQALQKTLAKLSGYQWP